LTFLEFVSMANNVGGDFFDYQLKRVDISSGEFGCQTVLPNNLFDIIQLIKIGRIGRINFFYRLSEHGKKLET